MFVSHEEAGEYVAQSGGKPPPLRPRFWEFPAHPLGDKGVNASEALATGTC